MEGASPEAALLLGAALGVVAAALSDWRLLLFAAAGIAAAHAGGMKAVGVGDPANVAAAERRIADLSEIRYAELAALMA